MKRFVLALALTGLMSVTALAGNVPINGVVGGEIPTNGAVAGNVPINGAPAPASTTTSSTLLVTVLLTVLGLR
jgi:hypothetical protein